MEARKKEHNHSLPVQWFLLHEACFQQVFSVQDLLSDSLPFLYFCFQPIFKIRCATREDQVVQHPPLKHGYLQQEE